MTAPDPGAGRDGPGSLAEEAARLAEAVAGWAQGALSDVDGHLATGSAECALCPVCRLLSVVRGMRPEVVDHLAEAAGSLVAAVRAVAAEHEREWAARPSAPVERIDID